MLWGGREDFEGGRRDYRGFQALREARGYVEIGNSVIGL